MGCLQFFQFTNILRFFCNKQRATKRYFCEVFSEVTDQKYQSLANMIHSSDGKRLTGNLDHSYEVQNSELPVRY